MEGCGATFKECGVCVCAGSHMSPSTQEKQEEQEFKVIFPYSELETSLIQRNKTGPETAQW